MSIAGVSCMPGVILIKRNNHVYQIQTPEGGFCLKTYTKDWYSPEPAETHGCVAHEAGAYRILEAHGLATPRVRLADETCDNPLKRPFLLLEMLPGQPLTEALQTATSRDDFEAILRSVGRYMAQMHGISFRFPGYLQHIAGPATSPNPDGWQHPIWSADVFKKLAFDTWEADSQIAHGGLVERAKHLLAVEEEALRDEYQPPKFTHGDCHAHQFFLSNATGEWKVTGVVDMEVASAGDYGADFVKLGIELAGGFAKGSDWWTPLLAGYGREPAFGPMKLRFAASAYDCDYLGPHNWPGSRASRLAHILDARDWRSLFDLSSIGLT